MATVSCIYCDNVYKSLKTLDNHVIRRHSPKQIILSDDGKKITVYKCYDCGNIYNRIDNYKRHVNVCKGETDPVKKIIRLERENKQLREKHVLMENKILKLENNIVAPKSIRDINRKLDRYAQKIELNGNIGGDLNGGIHNITNVFNIIQLGSEKLNELLSNKDQLKVLKRNFCSLDYLIENIHCGDKYPQLHNIIITNIKNDIAYKYDNKMKNFIAMDKDELLTDLMNERVSDIEDFYDTHYEKLDKNTKYTLDKFLTKIQKDKKFQIKKKNEIKFLMYNNCSKIIDNFKAKI